MSSSPVLIAPVAAENAEAAAAFLTEWVISDDADARPYLARHTAEQGASLIAMQNGRVTGMVCTLWQSNYPGFRDRGIPLVHQLSVAEPFRRQGVATRLMDTMEDLARSKGAATLGITVGLFDAYGPAQHLYARRGAVISRTAAEPARASSRCLVGPR